MTPLSVGTEVVFVLSRSRNRFAGVVAEIVPRQKFPATPNVTRALDCETRYVIRSAERDRPVIRRRSEVEVMV